MPCPTPVGHHGSVSDQPGDPIRELTRAVTALSYAMGRNKVHTELIAGADIKVERAARALLRVLRHSDRPLRINELAQQLLVQAPHVTRQVAQLESQGLVARSRDAADQRAQLVLLTQRGMDAIDALEAAVRRRLGDVLRDEPAEDILAAARIMNRLAMDTLGQPPRGADEAGDVGRAERGR